MAFKLDFDGFGLIFGIRNLKIKKGGSEADVLSIVRCISSLWLIQLHFIIIDGECEVIFCQCQEKERVCVERKGEEREWE